MPKTSAKPSPHTNPQPSEWQFSTPEEALFWSADVLRSRRTPKLTILWAYVLAEAPEPTPNQPQAARRTHLPTQPDDRFSLAMAVEHILTTMADEGRILRLHAWGDWVSEAQLAAAQRVQAQAHRQGQRVMLNHRLSFRQLGLLWGCDHKTAAKRIRQALTTLSKRLQHEGLLFIPPSPD